MGLVICSSGRGRGGNSDRSWVSIKDLAKVWAAFLCLRQYNRTVKRLPFIWAMEWNGMVTINGKWWGYFIFSISTAALTVITVFCPSLTRMPSLSTAKATEWKDFSVNIFSYGNQCYLHLFEWMGECMNDTIHSTFRVAIYLHVSCYYTAKANSLHASMYSSFFCSILAATPDRLWKQWGYKSQNMPLHFNWNNPFIQMLQHMGALFSPFYFQIDTWLHRAHCLFYVSICTTSRLMGTQPETPRQSWNILSAGAPRLINGTLDSMINTCASSYYKKIGGNLRWPGIDFFSPLSPRPSSPLPSLSPSPWPRQLHWSAGESVSSTT